VSLQEVVFNCIYQNCSIRAGPSYVTTVTDDPETHGQASGPPVLIRAWTTRTSATLCDIPDSFTSFAHSGFGYSRTNYRGDIEHHYASSWRLRLRSNAHVLTDTQQPAIYPRLRTFQDYSDKRSVLRLYCPPVLEFEALRPLANNELEITSKEVVVTRFEAMFRKMPGWTDRTHETLMCVGI
jgi:hypothetical protein